jgi:O-antigen/teichoic acid export membrane protein
VGVVLALNHFGVWSLVGQALSAQLAQLVSLWTLAIWHPHPRFEWAAIKVVAPFGSRMLLSTITESAFENLNVIVIGKLFSPTTLGFYSRADNLWRMTMSNFSSILSGVAFPILATIKNSPERLRRALKKSVEMLAFISYPAAIGLVAVARPLVLALLTRKWAPCIPYLQVLGGVWALYPMHAINGSLLMAQGHSKLYLRLQLIRKTVCLATFPLLFLGIYPFLCGQIANSWIGYYLNCYYSGKLLHYPMSAQLRDSSPYIGCAVLMGICIQSVKFLHIPHSSLELILEVALGVVSYVLFCALFRLPALAYAWDIIRKRSAKKKMGTLQPVEAKVVS